MVVDWQNYQCGVVCALRIKKMTPFSLENEVYSFPDRGIAVDVDKCGSLAVRFESTFESTDPYNHLD